MLHGSTLDTEPHRRDGVRHARIAKCGYPGSSYGRSLHSSTRLASRLKVTRYWAAFCSFRS
jgi:hypothetical protein